ncbi:MAG TPA: hypothetical protein VMW41_03750 [Candidatus Bathyarchaeia archaeon]|nr:hypothetical protein [Candidatus Bathyarchaeia archaeon]
MNEFPSELAVAVATRMLGPYTGVDSELLELLSKDSSLTDFEPIIGDAISRLEKTFPESSDNGRIPDEYKPYLLVTAIVKVNAIRRSIANKALIGEVVKGKVVGAVHGSERQVIIREMEVLNSLDRIVGRLSDQRASYFEKEQDSGSGIDHSGLWKLNRQIGSWT